MRAVPFAPLLLLLAAGACGPDPREASTENFARVLQAEVRRPPVCLRTGELPAVERGTLLGDHLSRPTGAERQDALVAAGLLRVARVDTVPTPLSVRVERAYELTEQGRAAYRDDLPAVFGPRTGVCAGTPKIVDVVRFTEPADARGRRVSRVTYRYRLDALPGWVRHPAIQAAYPRETQAILRAEREPVEASAELVLGSEGWAPAEEPGRR